MDEQRRSFDIPLSFLEPGASYEAVLYRDAEDAHYESNPQAYVIEEVRCNKQTFFVLFFVKVFVHFSGWVSDSLALVYS